MELFASFSSTGNCLQNYHPVRDSSVIQEKRHETAVDYFQWTGNDYLPNSTGYELVKISVLEVTLDPKLPKYIDKGC